MGEASLGEGRSPPSRGRGGAYLSLYKGGEGLSYRISVFPECQKKEGLASREKDQKGAKRLIWEGKGLRKLLHAEASSQESLTRSGWGGDVFAQENLSEKRKISTRGARSRSHDGKSVSPRE